jgi:hypothetical protein
MKTALFLFSQFEIRPLTDYAKYVDGVAAAFEKQGASKQAEAQGHID